MGEIGEKKMAVKVKYKKTIYGGRKCYQEIKKGRYYTFENDEWCLASKDYEKDLRSQL